MNREVLDKWCERGILALVLSILIFGPLAMGAAHLRDFIQVQFLTAGVLLLWIFRLWLSVRVQLLWPPICWAALGFTVYAVIRYFTADIEYVARLEVMRVLVYSSLFFVILNNLYRQEHAQTITIALLFLAMGIAWYALYQFITRSNQVWTLTSPYSGRASGTFISPNSLAGFLELMLPLGLSWTLVSRAGAGIKIFTGYASLAILAGIAVTISRGSWIAVTLTLMVLFGVLCFYRTFRLPALILLAILVAGGIFFVPQTQRFVERFQKFYDRGVIDDDARFALWRPATQMWRDNLWLGVGPNHFNYRFREYRPELVQLQPDRVHNDYLNTLADWGIVGMAWVLLACGFLVAGVLKTWSRLSASSSPGLPGARRSNKLALVAGCGFGLMALMLHSVVDFNMHIPANAILVISLMAILSSSLRFATESYWFTPRLWVKATMTVMLVVLIGCFAWQGKRLRGEESWLTRAEAAAEFSPERLAALEKAYAIEPMNFSTTYAIGEELRRLSLQGGNDEATAKAMVWFERGMSLNPYDGYNYMRRGMCFDWLRRHGEAATDFKRAVELDPNGYFTTAHMGWHHVQVREYAAARLWLERSLRLQWKNNPIAATHLELVNERMLYAATNRAIINLDALAR